MRPFTSVRNSRSSPRASSIRVFTPAINETIRAARPTPVVRMAATIPIPVPTIHLVSMLAQAA